jgi:ATP-binding protein involved in chromosome partitioning
MFRKSNIEVLGVVENMSYFICPHCSNITYIFGQGGAKKLRETMNVEIIGQIPLYPAISTSGDEGIPIVLQENNSNAKIAEAFLELASKVIEKLEL